MKPSRGLSFLFSPLRSLNSIIHPPLPLTKRQSNELVDLLKTSFRTELAASSHKPSIQDVLKSEAQAGKFNSLADAYINRLLKGPAFSNNHDASGEVDQINEDNPFARLRGFPTPDTVCKILHKHTAQMVEKHQSDVEDDWAVRVVTQALQIFNHSPYPEYLLHLGLRRQIINTLVRGGKVDMASAMLENKWLLSVLEVSNDHFAVMRVAAIQASIIKEVIQEMEYVRGLNAAAAHFLEMVDSWKQNVGRIPYVRYFQLSGIETSFNPFRKAATFLLFRYARQMSPEVASLRAQLYDTCIGWIHRPLTNARLEMLFKNQPVPLYEVVKTYPMENITPGNLRLYTATCFDLVLFLVCHQRLDEALEVVNLIRTRLVGRVPSLQSQMVDEIEKLLHAPGVDIMARLAEQLPKDTENLSLIDFWKNSVQVA
ncbi:hypothetical protein BDZ91DRAFT_732811 [Kalaharituber pfeilii]|nr:hypothetical protein BDZ91DRAFT_732811 [Kalaharituber pfeilii]